MHTPDSPDSPDWDEDREAFDDIVMDSMAEVECPHCGETMALSLDPGSGSVQDYVEDCHVCCRPWRVRVQFDSSGTAEVYLEMLA